MRCGALLRLALLGCAATAAADLAFYDRLGITPSATCREVRLAWKVIALATHPDRPENLAQAEPQKVQVKKDFDEAAFAYTVLSTPEQRQLYDELGEDHIDKGLFVQTLPYDEYTTFAPFDGDEHIETWDYHEWRKVEQSQEAYLILFYTPHHDLAKDILESWRTLSAKVTDFIHVVAVDCSEPDSTFLCWEWWKARQDPRSMQLPAVFVLEAGINKGDIRSRHEFDQVHSIENYYSFAVDSHHLDITELSQTVDWDQPIDQAAFQRPWVVSVCFTPTCNNDFEKEVGLALYSLAKIGHVECETSQGTVCDDIIKRAGEPAETGQTGTRFYLFPSGIGRGSTAVRLADSVTTDCLGPLLKAALLALPPLPRISNADLALALQPVPQTDDGQNRRNMLEGREWLVLFISPESDWCTQPNQDVNGHQEHFNECQRVLRAFHQVVRRLGEMQAKGDSRREILPVVFDCQPSVFNAEADKMCRQLAAGQDASKPELLLIKASSDRKPHRFHDWHQLDRADLVISWATLLANSFVDHLEASDFQTRVEENKEAMLVFFYTPWCGEECLGGFQEFNFAAAADDEEMDETVAFARVDCEHHFVLCHEQHISKYPTLLLYINGTRHQFDLDTYTKADYLRFIHDSFEPNVHEFTVQDFRDAIWDPDHPTPGVAAANLKRGLADIGWVVDFFAPWCSHCHTMSPVFESAGNALKGVIKFGKLNCELEVDFCRKMSVRFYPTIREYPADRMARAEGMTQYASNKPDAMAILEFALQKIDSDVKEWEAPGDSFSEAIYAEPLVSRVVLFTKVGCQKCREVEIQLHAISARLRERAERREREDTARGSRGAEDDLDDTQLPVELEVLKFECDMSPQHAATCQHEDLEGMPAIHYYSGPKADAYAFNSDHDALSPAVAYEHWHITEILAFIYDHWDLDRREVSSGRVRNRVVADEVDFEPVPNHHFRFHAEL